MDWTLVIVFILFFAFLIAIIWLARNALNAEPIKEGKSIDKMSNKELKKLKQSM